MPDRPANLVLDNSSKPSKRAAQRQNLQDCVNLNSFRSRLSFQRAEGDRPDHTHGHKTQKAEGHEEWVPGEQGAIKDKKTQTQDYASA